METVFPKLPQLLMELISTLCHILFRNLHDQVFHICMNVPTMAVVDFVQYGWNIRIIKILCGKIDGNRNQGKPMGTPDRDLPAHLLGHEKVQFVHQVILLQHRDEFPR